MFILMIYFNNVKVKMMARWRKYKRCVIELIVRKKDKPAFLQTKIHRAVPKKIKVSTS